MKFMCIPGRNHIDTLLQIRSTQTTLILFMESYIHLANSVGNFSGERLLKKNVFYILYKCG